MHISIRGEAGARRGAARSGLLAGALLGATLLAGCGSSARPVAKGPLPERSAGPPMVVVPRLVGRHQEDAHRIAARHGFKLRWTGFVGKLGNGRYNVSCVKVLSQSPVAGERRPRGASIAIIEAACRTPPGKPHVL
jgi:PASTA domain-containing protein